jgi:hypothetical protein
LALAIDGDVAIAEAGDNGVDIDVAPLACGGVGGAGLD